MKKYKTFIDDNEKDAMISASEVTVDQSTIKIVETSKLGTKIEIDGEIITVDDVIKMEEGGVYRVEISGYTIDVKVVDPISEALNLGTGAGGDIFSPMSGTISSVDVKEGQEVSDGQVLVVISAMKMENQITSPVEGIVRDIKVNNNEQVPSGKLLLTVEPKE